MRWKLINWLLGLLLSVAPAFAKDADRIELKAVVGTAGFLDEVTDYHAAVGGAARFRLSSALSLEPEFLYLRESPLDQDYSFQVALIREYRGRSDVRPYLVAGAGLLHSRFRFPGAQRERFSANEFTGGGGVGVRIRVGDQLWFSPEFRFGWEPFVRVTVSLGYTFR